MSNLEGWVVADTNLEGWGVFEETGQYVMYMRYNDDSALTLRLLESLLDRGLEFICVSADRPMRMIVRKLR